MEDVLCVYQRPYDPLVPVVCFDETNKVLQAHLEGREPLTPSVESNALQRVDYTYQPKGSANIFMFCEPLRGWRRTAVTEHKAGIDLAPLLKRLVDEDFPDAERIVLVSDNLKTHHAGVLYDVYPPDEARRIAEKLEWHYTPVHGSWLNVAEIELSVLHRQCFPSWVRLASIEAVRMQVRPWEVARNTDTKGVDWHFTTSDARIKLRRLYPIPLVNTL
jgi:hypothetical protein